METVSKSLTSKLLLLILFVIGAIALKQPNLITAQQTVESPIGWTTASLIIHIEGESTVRMPSLIGDCTGLLHLLYLSRPPDAMRTSIDYMVWDGLNWSLPVDILLDPESPQMTNLQTALDENGVLHAVWSGQSLRYSSVQISQADLPNAWSRPQTIANTQLNPAIIAGDNGIIYISYANYEGNIVLLSSADDGATWTIPQTIAQVNTYETLPNDISIAQDDSGRLHIGWTEYQLPDGWPPQATFYTFSLDNGENWTEPREVAGPNYGQIGIGTQGENIVHLVWRSTIGGDGTFHQWSDDGGQSWSEPSRSDDRGGFSGPPTFAVDTTGVMHSVLGRTYYANWFLGRLSAYQDLRTHPIPAVISSGEMAVLAITNGNQLHVVYETDFQYLWHTMNSLDAPLLADNCNYPDSAVEPEPAINPTAMPLNLSELIPAQPYNFEDIPPPPQPRNALTALFATFLPVLLILIVIVGFNWQKRRHPN